MPSTTLHTPHRAEPPAAGHCGRAQGRVQPGLQAVVFEAGRTAVSSLRYGQRAGHAVAVAGAAAQAVLPARRADSRGHAGNHVELC